MLLNINSRILPFWPVVWLGCPFLRQRDHDNGDGQVQNPKADYCHLRTRFDFSVCPPFDCSDDICEVSGYPCVLREVREVWAAGGHHSGQSWATTPLDHRSSHGRLLQQTYNLWADRNLDGGVERWDERFEEESLEKGGVGLGSERVSSLLEERLDEQSQN